MTSPNDARDLPQKLGALLEISPRNRDLQILIGTLLVQDASINLRTEHIKRFNEVWPAARPSFEDIVSCLAAVDHCVAEATEHVRATEIALAVAALREAHGMSSSLMQRLPASDAEAQALGDGK